MFKIGDRIRLIDHPYSIYIINNVRSDKKIDIMPINVNHNIKLFTNVVPDIFEYDFIFYRRKKINEILTKIK